MNATIITAPPATQYIEIVREFDAPRGAVFRAATDPDLVVQWLGPREHSMQIDYWDARSGGGTAQLRDGALASGMERGIRDSMDRLAQLLAG